MKVSLQVQLSQSPRHLHSLRVRWVVCLQFARVEDGLSELVTAVQQGRLKNSESLNNLHALLGHLSESQQADLSEVIKSFPCLFGDTPTQTHVIEHNIDVGDAQPIRQRFYRVNPEKKK